MAQSISAQLDEVLIQLERNVPLIEATAVVSADGLVIASRLPRAVEEDRIGAMSAAILAISKRSGLELERGEIHRVLIDGGDGYLAINSIGNDAVLVALVDKNVRLGMLFYECRKCVEELKKII